MKKTIILISVFVLSSIISVAQSKKGNVEVLYFKANLACCKAKSCNVLEADIKTIVEKNYPKGNVIFKEIKIADETNKALVEKYKAQSQTVIIVKKMKKKESFVDISDIIKKYLQTQNKTILESEINAQIASILKK